MCAVQCRLVLSSRENRHTIIAKTDLKVVVLVWAVAGDVHMYMGVHLLVMPLVTCCVQCGRSVIDGTSLSGVSVCVCAQSISVTVCVPNREDFIFNNRDSHACAVSSVSSVVCPPATSWLCL